MATFGPRRVTKFSAAGAIVVLCVLLLAFYVFLTKAGHWQADEYETFSAIRTAHFGFVLDRIAHWSPRPLSEVLIFFYSQAVEAAGRPLIGPVLTLLFLLLVGCAVAPWLMFRRQEQRTVAEASAVPLALVCLFLLGRQTGELFYWPMASLAYIPVLAAVTFLFGLIENDQAEHRPYWIMVALTVAALSAEVGAMFVLIYALTSIVMRLLRSARSRYTHAQILCDVLPLMAASWVLYSIVAGRVASRSDVVMAGESAHQLVPSMLASIPRTLEEFVVMDGRRAGLKNAIFGAVTKGTYLVGMIWLGWSRAENPRVLAPRIAFVVATLSIVPMTIFAAYFQYGTQCCERHFSLRQCMIFLTLGAMSSLVSSLIRTRRDRSLTARINAIAWSMRGLLLALLVAASQSSGRIKHDLRAADDIDNAQDATWASGRSDATSMVITQFKPGEVVGGNGVHPVGDYPASGVPPEEVPGMLRYFGKRGALVVDSPTKNRDKP